MTSNQHHDASNTDTWARIWVELSDDAEHPTLDGATRLLIDQHHHELHHDALDEWQTVPVTAVFIPDGLSGARIELGPWSLDAAAARILATSLNALADAAEPR